MSLFENISFINEGEQAEEYKARKAKEKEEARDKEDDRVFHRDKSWHDKDPKTRGRDGNLYISKKKAIDDKARDIAYKNNPKVNAWMLYDDAMQHKRNVDAIKRHMRRHPDQYKESSIFESVQFINE